MNIELTKQDRNDIRKAFNLLIDAESDTINYSSLFVRLGINSLEVEK